MYITNIVLMFVSRNTRFDGDINQEAGQNGQTPEKVPEFKTRGSDHVAERWCG